MCENSVDLNFSLNAAILAAASKLILFFKQEAPVSMQQGVKDPSWGHSKQQQLPDGRLACTQKGGHWDPCGLSAPKPYCHSTADCCTTPHSLTKAGRFSSMACFLTAELKTVSLGSKRYMLRQHIFRH